MSDSSKSDLTTNMKSWLGNSEPTWQHMIENGSMSEIYCLSVDVENDKLTIIRGWQNGTNPPAYSIDEDINFEVLSGPIDAFTFPHSGPDVSDLEPEFRSGFLGEDIEFLYQAGWNKKGAFIARTAKVGRDEHLVAGHLHYEDNKPVVTVDYRVPLQSLNPEFVSKLKM